MSNTHTLKLETANTRVCSFYKQHPSFDFEQVNLLFVEFFDKILTTQQICDTENANPNTTSVASLNDVFKNLDTTIIDKISDFQKENTVRQHIVNNNLLDYIDNMFSKYNPKPSETNQNFAYVLSKIYSTSEVSRLEDAFVIKRYMKPPVLFETVDSSENISNEEVQCFIKTIEDKNCHGVFVSQNSGISSKPNFHIEYHKGNICIFVHNGDYDFHKVKLAVQIIDSLSVKLKELNHGHDENAISKATLDDINKEYQLFVSQKDALVNVYKECQKKVLSQIDEIRLPCLDKYLSTKYTNTTQKQGFKCDLCKCYNANNLKALAAHKRGCSRKNVFVPLHIQSV
jgi:hypothetical protein